MPKVYTIIEPPTPGQLGGSLVAAPFLDHPAAVLRQLGADSYDLLLPESHTLPLVVRPSEQLLGVVYGRYRHVHYNTVSTGRGMLVATDGRLRLLDKKPLFVKNLEISYDKLSGISYARVGFISTVTLHTKIGDIILRTCNQHCARQFHETVAQRLSQNPG